MDTRYVFANFFIHLEWLAVVSITEGAALWAANSPNYQRLEGKKNDDCPDCGEKACD